MKKKVYRGKLSYLVSEGIDKEPRKISFDQEIPIEVTEDLSSVPPGSKEEEGVDNGSESSSLNGHAQADDSSSTGSGSSANGKSVPVPVVVAPPSTDLLVPLKDPVPDSWITKEQDYLGVSSLMIPMLTSDFYADPDIQIGSGKISLSWIDGSMTRKGALSMLTSADTGRHMKMEEVYKIEVKAFRLEPLSPPGMLTIDGEAVVYGAMQAQIHPGLARVMSRRRRKKSSENLVSKI